MSLKSKKGRKICPSCNKPNGPRAFVCKHDGCNYNFKPGQTPKTKQVLKGTGKGKKQCPECSKLTGCRTHVCQCGHQFGAAMSAKPKPIKIKRIKFKKLVTDWTELQIGDRVRALKGHGPHYIDENGEKQFFGERGVLTIKHKDRNGLLCYGPAGAGYIYMGPTVKSDVIPNGVKEAHKLIRLKPKNLVTNGV